MTTEFTPWLSLFGGVLIGLSATLLMLMLGRVLGATGILAGLMFPSSSQDFLWRAALIAGMVSAPLLMLVITGQTPEVSVPISTTMLLGGGLLVGVGVTFGGGCTSGHGVCGIARISPRSIVATVAFMTSATATVYIIRHVLGA